MQASEATAAIAAAMSTASALDLVVDNATVLNDSNRLVLRLMPCDVVARVARVGHPFNVRLEVEVVRRLAGTGAAVAVTDPRVAPRVYERDGFAVTLWTHYEPVASPELPPRDYASMLEGLRAAMRKFDVAAPHFMDRVGETQNDVARRAVTPDLSDADRNMIAGTLRRLKRSIDERAAGEQLLHGEPHPWNVLSTKHGLLLTDFENAARGPIEYDLAWVPEAVSECYPGTDRELINDCRGLMLAIVATWRFRWDDEHPSGRRSGIEFLSALREGRRGGRSTPYDVLSSSVSLVQSSYERDP
jgi:hypothetical protein